MQAACERSQHSVMVVDEGWKWNVPTFSSGVDEGWMWQVTISMVSLSLVGVWAACEMSHYLWCHYHLFYSGCMGCTWKVTLFMVSLPLVLQWVYGLHVKGHTIYCVTATCFTVGVWAECESWQHPCVTISCVLQWLYNYAGCERWQHSCCYYHLF